MRDSDIENVLGQLHKKGFTLQRAPLDQSLERDPNDFQKLVENIARSPQVQIGFPYKDKELLLNEKKRRERERYTYWPWRQVIYVKPAWLKSVYTPRKLNRPLNVLEYEDGKNNLAEHSKVYVVLDPDADITKSDVRDLSDIVSSLLAKSSSSKKSLLKDLIQKERRYKGFIVNDKRRRMRDSIEKHVEKDSIERDYKPKRSRIEYSGVGGRTPIPYIRNRGDIYERDD